MYTISFSSKNYEDSKIREYDRAFEKMPPDKLNRWIAKERIILVRDNKFMCQLIDIFKLVGNEASKISIQAHLTKKRSNENLLNHIDYLQDKWGVEIKEPKKPELPKLGNYTDDGKKFNWKQPKQRLADIVKILNDEKRFDAKLDQKDVCNIICKYFTWKSNKIEYSNFSTQVSRAKVKHYSSDSNYDFVKAIEEFTDILKTLKIDHQILK